MPSKNKGIIDLRRGKRPPRDQAPLFSMRPSRAPENPKPARPGRPISLRARRRRIRVLVAFGLLILCGGLFYGVSWASYLPQFAVSSISVSGARGMSDELIVGAAEAVLDDGSHHILSRRNIFLYPRQKMEEQIIVSFPPIRSAHITRTSFFSNTLVITVEERQPFARWCTDGGAPCYFMDENGFIYAAIGEGDLAAQATSSTPYIFAGGLLAQGSIASSSDPIGRSFVRAHLPGIISLLTYLGQAGFTPLGAHVENDQDFSVQLEEGFLLKASYGADASTLAKNLQLVLSSDTLKGKRDALEYIDLRFGNRVYFKLKGEEQQSTQ